MKKPKKKFMQGKMPRKKIHAKKEVKKKKFMQKEGPIVTFIGWLSVPFTSFASALKDR